MNDEQKALLIANIAGTMASVSRDVVERQLQHFFKADPAYGGGNRKGIGSQSGLSRSDKKNRPHLGGFSMQLTTVYPLF